MLPRGGRVATGRGVLRAQSGPSELHRPSHTEEQCAQCAAGLTGWPCQPEHGYEVCACGGEAPILNAGLQIPGLSPFRNETYAGVPPSGWYGIDPGNNAQEDGGVGMPWAPNGGEWYFKNNAVYLPRAAPMPQIYQIMMEALSSGPSKNSNIIFQHAGGKSNEVAIDATPFPHRGVEWMILINGQGPLSDDVADWVDTLTRRLLPYSYSTSATDLGPYPSEWIAYTFGQNAKKLCTSKAKWDPLGRMRQGNFYFTDWCKKNF